VLKQKVIALARNIPSKWMPLSLKEFDFAFITALFRLIIIL
tara:strand:- start:325 stop:447 length:123 start_codon:yes stop_codon:yes gene_type:complete